MSSEYSTESVSTNAVFEKEYDTVDFSASVESKSIEVESAPFGENVIIDTLTTHEAKAETEDSCCEFVCNVVDSESHFEIMFMNEGHSEEEVKFCNVGMEVKNMTVESSCECSVEMIETGIEVYKITCEIGTETSGLEIVEISSSYELSCLSVDCERVEEEIVMVDTVKEEEMPEMIRTEDELVCCTVSMNEMSTIVECNMVEASVVMEVRYVEDSGEWMEEIKRIDESSVTDKTETENVSTSSEVEYCTIDVQFEESKLATSESGFETKSVTIDSYSIFEMHGEDVETEVERTVLVNTAIATEEEIESKEICTEFKSVSIEMSSEYSTESVSTNAVFEKEYDTVDFSASVESKSIEVGSAPFGENVIIDTLTTHEAKAETEDSCCEFVCNVVDSESHFEIMFMNEGHSEEEVKFCNVGMEVKNMTVESSCECSVEMIETGIEVSKITCEIGTETSGLEIVEISSSYELSCLSVDCERVEEEIVMVDTVKEEEMPEMIRTEDELVCCTVSMFDIGNAVDAFAFLTQDIGIQIQLELLSSDFSQMFNADNDLDLNLDLSVDFDDASSEQSVSSSDGFEWAEVGLELDLRPISLATQTDQTSHCDTYSFFELISINDNFSTSFDNVAHESIFTQCSMDEVEYILQYIRDNKNSEIIKTIREIFTNDVLFENCSSQTLGAETLLDWFIETVDIDELKTFCRQDRYLVEESQNTESIINRSVFTQSDSHNFNDIVTIYRAPIFDSDSDNIHATRYDIIEEIEENIVVEKEDFHLFPNIECQTQTNIIETRTAGLQTGVHCHLSTASEANFKDDYLADVTDHEYFEEFHNIDQVDIEIGTINRRAADSSVVSDNETQTTFESRSCAVQTRIYFQDTSSILTSVDIDREEMFNSKRSIIETDHCETTEIIAHTINRIPHNSKFIQTDVIDLHEPYWKNLLEDLLDIYDISLKFNIGSRGSNKIQVMHDYSDSESQTEQIYIEECLINSEIDRYTFLAEELPRPDFKTPVSSIMSHISTISEDIERKIVEETIPDLKSIKFGKLRYSVVSESSQTDDRPIKEDFESVFGEENHKSSKYTMRTEMTNVSLMEVIDTSIQISISIDSVCNPINNTRYPLNVAINRGWIDNETGVYCNPSTLESMPIERAVELKKIELVSDSKCPNLRRFGLYKERVITKIERIKVKNVLNTETGDLYDEKTAEENGILCADGRFYDKEARTVMAFEAAVLGNYVEVYPETEMIDQTIDSEEIFKIKSVRNTATGIWYNFHDACEAGLVNLTESTFRDTKRNCDRTFNESMQTDIIQWNMISRVDNLYIENEVNERIIQQRMSLSSESYPSRTQSLLSTDLSNYQ